MFWRNLSFLLALAAMAQPSSDSSRVIRLDEEFVRTTLALSPVSATAQGYHEDQGVVLDELLDDYSQHGIEKEHAVYERFLRQATELSKERATDEEKADLDIIRLQCQYGLLDLDRIRGYRHNPTYYVETIGNAIYSPFVLDYAPESKRLVQITARIEKVPMLLEVAKQNLTSAPAVWNRVAQEEGEGDIELIDKTIRAKVPAALKARYDSAATKAIAALGSFNDFLKSDLSKRTCDWRLGADLYEQKWRLSLASGDTVQRTLQDAEAKLTAIKEEMRKQALTLYPRYFPGQAVPKDATQLVSKVLERIAQRHATPAQYFDEARRDLAETSEFVRKKGFLALPKTSTLEVIPTPAFMRGIYGVGGFSPAPVLEPQLGSFYWITPLTPDMSAGRVESKLREYNREGLKVLTIHEAMPGHYVQFEYASDVRPKWRAALREIYSNTPYVEGWAVYATELMIDQGYENTPEMRLTFEKQMLRVLVDAIMDVKLQTMQMTDEEAMRLMLDTFQEKEEADKKLQRAKLSSCQLPTYFVGWRGWDQLRAAEQARLGSAFRLARFHERALNEGAVPLPVLSKMMVE
jgi:uncharacterized protein (DUF885 family)